MDMSGGIILILGFLVLMVKFNPFIAFIKLIMHRITMGRFFGTLLKASILAIVVLAIMAVLILLFE